ncbi:MAG: HDOD domain-containing protein [Candidatus Krumholzibacteria bacterium]|nr:HDOD domain-containing protein [Candidatus Krumholzibacteria bacterium]
MATQTDDLQVVDEVIANLEPATDKAEFIVPEPETSPLAGDDLPLEMISLLRAGISQMSTMDKVREFPEFFLRLAQSTGLRLVLLKRWTSGLQVFMEENIQLPAEAKKKRRDGKAPIPTTDTDIFQAITEDATVYAGPVPVKHFPLDLTLMLGRGSRDRQIIILPLPSQNHWNTFLYLDADKSTENSLAVAEILAHYALSRMCLLNKGARNSKGKVAGILKAEMHRRKTSPDSDADLPEVPVMEEAVPATADAAPEIPASDGATAGSLTPEAILRHSGELPALPKAACHIMAVIEDPGTTATKLEHALAMDQALTAKVLRIANSPFYGAVREITTVSEAIVRLGFVAIRNWTLVTAARSVFLSPGAGMLYQKIWRQSVMSAMAGQLVGQAIGGCNPDSVFIGGLMQNIGQLVLARSHPELFQEILNESVERGLPYHVVERGRLGFDHGELGAMLIKEWNLSQDLEEAVRWHHRFSDEEAKSDRIAAMIALGEEIALCSSGLEENQECDVPDTVDQDPGDEELFSDAAKFLGVTSEALAELKERAVELKIDPHFFS